MVAKCKAAVPDLRDAAAVANNLEVSEPQFVNGQPTLENQFPSFAELDSGAILGCMNHFKLHFTRRMEISATNQYAEVETRGMLLPVSTTKN